MSQEIENRHPGGPFNDLDRLVRENLGLVYDLARRLDRSGQGPERSDLVSAGVIGLIQAAHTFDPGRGLAFSTIAVTRIRGAMLDEMRRWDEAPRSVRQKERLIKESKHTLGLQLGRDPTTSEIAGHLEVDSEEFHAWCDDVERCVKESLDAPAPGTADGARDLKVREVVADESAVNPVARLERTQALATLEDKLLQLPERERAVLSLYYLEGLRLKEIAKVFDVTESRVSQIRHGALQKLRSMMTLAGIEEA